MNNAPKAVVTGGCGFIGSHMVDLLIKEGHEVTIIDNLSTGRLDNLQHHRANPLLKIVQMDVSDLEGICRYMEGVDWVFHFAALADIVPSIQKPVAYYHSNVNGTFCVLEAARRTGVKRILYTASSSCYGIPDKYPTSETDEIRTMYPYAATKYMGEYLAMHWAQVYGLPVNSLRLFNVYGPRSRTSGTYGAVFGVFLAQKLAGKPFTVVGDGRQTRDFTFVTDVANAFYFAAKSDVTGQIFNVGSGSTYSVNRLVELLGGPVTHIPKRPGEPNCTFADISKIQKQLGWKPHVSFEEGVKILLDNIDYWRSAPVWTPESIDVATRDWFEYLK
ncbi:MAG: NAD-dependent dehydratase [Bdellovibrionales bacterium RIFOXYD1_FULL_53_11]|nr:MAG: NAD-dependent dehydratase [Bdellovibrionales bacterium RIFOXYD1_FULL_53_11]